MFASFDIAAEARSYTVDIEPGVATDYLRGLGRDVIVIGDEIFQERFATLSCPVLALPALETHKTLDEAARLVEAARASGLTRQGRIVAVGGGIIQDVACFVASIYMRGIAWTYLPSTVLGMVDSCIGGKSSINVARFKNLAGTMHPPERILIDTSFAQTLPIEHRAGGLCEAAKIAFARGPDAFTDYIERDAHPEMDDVALAEVVLRSLKAKQWFIEIDEFDRKERLTLNFGHTFAHAIESASGFAINHGAAVGLGVLCAIDLALARGLCTPDETLGAFQRHTLGLLRAIPDLPETFARIDRADFEKAFLSDKKHTVDALTLVLPVRDAGGLPLSLCRLPRDSEALKSVSSAVKHIQEVVA